MTGLRGVSGAFSKRALNWLSVLHLCYSAILGLIFSFALMTPQKAWALCTNAAALNFSLADIIGGAPATTDTTIVTLAAGDVITFSTTVLAGAGTTTIAITASPGGVQNGVLGVFAGNGGIAFTAGADGPYTIEYTVDGGAFTLDVDFTATCVNAAAPAPPPAPTPPPAPVPVPVPVPPVTGILPGTTDALVAIAVPDIPEMWYDPIDLKLDCTKWDEQINKLENRIIEIDDIIFKLNHRIFRINTQYDYLTDTFTSYNGKSIIHWEGYNRNITNEENRTKFRTITLELIDTMTSLESQIPPLQSEQNNIFYRLQNFKLLKGDCEEENAAVALSQGYTDNRNNPSVPALGAINALQPLSRLPGPLTILRTGPISVWVNGGWSRAKDNQAGADRSSDSWSFSSGINYQFLRQLSIGIAGQARGGDVESAALNASLDHSSYGVSVYVSGQILPGITGTGTVSYENGDNDITVGTTTGSFDTNLFAVSGSLSGAMQRGALTISPQLAVSYQTVDRAAYIDSVGTAVSGSTLDWGSVSGGINLAYLFTLADTAALRAIKPFVGVQGSWEFTGEGNFATAGGVVIVDDNQSSANFSGGVTILFNDGANVTLQGSYFGAGADVQGYTFSGSGSLPLRMFRRFPNSDSTLSFGANAGLRNPIRGRLGLDVPFN